MKSFLIIAINLSRSVKCNYVLGPVLCLLCFSAYPQQHSLDYFVDRASEKKSFPLSDVAAVEALVAKSRDTKAVRDASMYLGNNYYLLGQYDEAFGHYRKAYDMSVSRGNYKEAALAGEMIGTIYLRLKEYDKSLSWYTKILPYFKQAADRRGIISTQGNIAITQSQLGRAKEALQTLTAIRDFKGIDSLSKSSAFMAIGNIYLTALPNVPNAITNYKEALNHLGSKGNNRQRVLLLQNLAESYIAAKNYNEAYRYNAESEKFLLEIPEDALYVTLHRFYYEIDKAKGNNEAALGHLENEKEYLARADKSEVQLRLRDVEAMDNIRQQREAIRALEEQSRIDGYNLAIVLLSLGLAIAVAAFVILKYRKSIRALIRQVTHTEQKLGQSSEKIEELVLNIIKDNEFTGHLQDNLKNVQSSLTEPKSKKALSELVVDLQNFRSMNREKELLLSQVHTGFLDSLEQKVPGLSETEKQICVLIYLNLKNKDIAMVLNISVRSVENTRYRIRKKIGMARDEGLFDFIKSA